MLPKLGFLFLLYMLCQATSIETFKQNILDPSKELAQVSNTICIKPWNIEDNKHKQISTPDLELPLESCVSISPCMDDLASKHSPEKLLTKLQNSQDEVFFWGVKKENLLVEIMKEDFQGIQQTLGSFNEKSENDTVIICFKNISIQENSLDTTKYNLQSEEESTNTSNISQNGKENKLSTLSIQEVIKPSEFKTHIRQLQTTTITSYDRDSCLIPEIFAWFILLVLLVSLFHSLGVPEINGIFFFISLLQSNNLLAYINFSFSSEFTCFYKSLDYFNFEVFLNIPQIIKEIFIDNYVTSSLPYVFGIYGYSSDWFENGGKPFTLLIILFILWLIIKALSLIKFGTEILPLMLQQMHDKIVWNGVIRFLQVTFLSLLMASLLQLRNISFDTLSNILGFAFAILTSAILLFFVGNSYRLMKSKDLRDKTVKHKLGALYNDYWLDKETDKITVNLETIVMVKKAVQVATVIFVEDYPMVQTIIFLATESCQTILLFGKRRFKDKTAGKIINVISVTNFLNILVLCCMFLMEENDSLRQIFGWVVICISIFAYVVNIFLVIAEQYLMRDEVSEFYKKLCYGIWLFILGFFSCFCFVCINVNNFYWSRRARKNDNIKNSELALL